MSWKKQIDIACKDNKAYTPTGVLKLIQQAEKDNKGDLQAALDNKHEYKHLWEMYHGIFLALALYKEFGDKLKFNICSPLQDPPDLYYIQTNGNSAFPLEIMELYKHGGNFKNYAELVRHIWDKKGRIHYETCYLLLASRLDFNQFNVTKFAQELKNYDWKFQRIYLSFYTAQLEQWTFFEVFPSTQHNNNSMYFNNNKDKQYWY